MGAILPLPAELNAFVRRPPPQSLLVRGPPGTGKTTLAFALLQSFPGRRIYVSSRVRRTELMADFPWIDSFGPEAVDIVDFTEPEVNARDTMRAVAKSSQLVSESANAEMLRSLLLPGEVLEAWSRAAADRPTMIVLDSWDAIVERHIGRAQLDGVAMPPRAELERIALSQMASGPAFVVLVVEDRSAGQLEYLANGVVSLERKSTQDRLERWLELDKLRGVRIASPSYPFSLEGGRFQSAARLDLREVREAKVPEEEPDRIPGTIWPGSSEFATHFGRPLVGRLSLIEKDNDVPDAAVTLLLSSLTTSVIAARGRTLHVLPPRFHPGDLWQMYKGVASRAEFQRLVRAAATVPADPKDDVGSILVAFDETAAKDPERSAGKSRIPDGLRFLVENPNPEHPNLAVVWTSGLQALNALRPGSYTPENLPGLVQVALHRAVVHMVAVGTTDDPLTKALAPMAVTRIRMTARGGRVFVYGTDPSTPYLVLSDGGERVPYRLLLVV